MKHKQKILNYPVFILISTDNILLSIIIINIFHLFAIIISHYFINVSPFLSFLNIKRTILNIFQFRIVRKITLV